MENLSQERTLELLEDGKVAHIGVIDDGLPYVSPVSYVVIDQVLYFRTGPGRRLTALRAEPKVSIEVTAIRADGGWECVIAAGMAHMVEDQHIRERVVSALLAKYSEEIGSPLSRGSRSPLPQAAAFVGVALSDISGRTSGSWLSIPARPGRL